MEPSMISIVVNFRYFKQSHTKYIKAKILEYTASGTEKICISPGKQL